MKTCPNCHSQLNLDVVLCPSCGMQQGPQQQAAGWPPQPPQQQWPQQPQAGWPPQQPGYPPPQQAFPPPQPGYPPPQQSGYPPPQPQGYPPPQPQGYPPPQQPGYPPQPQGYPPPQHAIGAAGPVTGKKSPVVPIIIVSLVLAGAGVGIFFATKSSGSDKKKNQTSSVGAVPEVGSGGVIAAGPRGGAPGSLPMVAPVAPMAPSAPSAPSDPSDDDDDEAAPAPVVTGLGKSGDSTGIAECDTFIADYRTCMGKLPAAGAADMTAALEQMITMFRASAQQDANSTRQICVTTAAQMREAFKSLGCTIR